jgi:hypothetical protein
MCEVKHCKQKDVVVAFYGKDICQKHWDSHCEGKIDLKQELGLEETKCQG